MSIKQRIRTILMNSQKGQYLFYSLRILREKYVMATKTDEEYVKDIYKKRFLSTIDWKNLKTFGEKLQWLKLFYRDEVIPRCTDKYEVHQYLHEMGYGYLCNEIIGVYNNANEIDFESLPEKFVAKATHGSGWNLICKDKTQLNWKDTVRLMNSWLKLNLFAFGREWNYKDLQPRIIVEKFIEHEPLNDYKFMCFNGKPLYMQLNNDYEGVHYVDFYDLETWEHLPVTYMNYKRSEREIEKPEKFDEMMKLAKCLSERFPFVRVDFYNFGETILLGELTFFPAGGLWPFVPQEKGYNEIVGEKLKLPEPNYNLKLYKTICNIK